MIKTGRKIPAFLKLQGLYLTQLQEVTTLIFSEQNSECTVNVPVELYKARDPGRGRRKINKVSKLYNMVEGGKCYRGENIAR